MLSARDIKAAAREVGFDLCGITRAEELSEECLRFRRWLGEGRNGALDYLERNVEKRFDASLLVEGAESVVVCAISYKNEFSCGYGTHEVPRVASYAINDDYHDTIRNMLRRMASLLSLDGLGVSWRVFSDSAPVAEKSLAVRAGLGAIGRNSLLITPRHGSFVLLGELMVADRVDEYDAPFEEDLCGECRLCRNHCPNCAIGDDRTIDASRCISRLTIEPIAESADRLPLHGWLFGCDECQSVCPRNRDVPIDASDRLHRRFNPSDYPASRWRAMTSEEFRDSFSSTPLSRAGLARLLHNLE